MVEKYSQIFTGELQLCTEDGIIIGGGQYLFGNNSANFLPGDATLKPEFHLWGVLYRGDLHLVRALILLHSFHKANHRVRINKGT